MSQRPRIVVGMNARTALAADPDMLVRTRDVCALADVSRQAVNRWVQRGYLPVAIRHPGGRGQLRYRLADVLELFPALADRPWKPS